MKGGSSAIFDLKWNLEQVEFRSDAGMNEEDGKSFLVDYFRLDTDLDALRRTWEEKDALFQKNEQGIRLLR